MMAWRLMSGGALVLLLIAAFVPLSHSSMFIPVRDESRLIFAFRNATKTGMVCRKTTEQELAQMLPHMRREQICERARNETNLLVKVDGQERLRKAVKPLGLRSDGYTMGLENFALTAGEHDILISLEEGTEKKSELAQKMKIEKGRAYLIEYQSGAGFKTYGENEHAD